MRCVFLCPDYLALQHPNGLTINFWWNIMTFAPIAVSSPFQIRILESFFSGGAACEGKMEESGLSILADMNTGDTRGNHKKRNPLIWLDAFPQVVCSWQKLSFHWLPVVQPSALESSIHICHTDLNTTQRQNWREETPSSSLSLAGCRLQWCSTLIIAAWRYQHWRHLARPGLSHMPTETVIDIFPSWHFLSVCNMRWHCDQYEQQCSWICQGLSLLGLQVSRPRETQRHT